MHRLTRIGSLLLIGAVTATPASAGTVFANQPGGAGGANTVGYIFSQDEPFLYQGESRHQSIADNFSMSSGGTITRMTWWGISRGGTSTQNVNGFLISIFHNVAGTVGSLAYSATVAIGDVTVTQDNPPPNFLGHRYSISSLENDMAAANLGAGAYWFSVVALMVPGDPNEFWAWQTLNDGGDGEAFTTDAFRTNWQYFDGAGSINNVAFVLEGHIVPVPPAAPLEAAGLLGLIVRRRHLVGR